MSANGWPTMVLLAYMSGQGLMYLIRLRDQTGGGVGSTRNSTASGGSRDRSQVAAGRPAKSTGLPSRLLGFLTQSTGLLGGRTFLLVLKK